MTNKELVKQVVQEDRETQKDKAKVLYSKESEAFKRLQELVKKDRVDGKIYAFNCMESISKTCVFLVERPDYFNFTHATYEYQVNKNGTIYVKGKVLKSLVFKNGKLWTITTTEKKKVRAADLSTVLPSNPTFFVGSDMPKKVQEALIPLLQKVPFLNTFDEYPMLNIQLSYNYAVKHKVFSIKDRITYALGGINGAKLLEAFNGDVEKTMEVLQDFLSMRLRKQLVQYNHLIDDDKINPEIFTSCCHIFFDAIRMASVFNNTVKLRWSAKRFKEFHDDMSKTITNRLAELNNFEFYIPKYMNDFVEYINASNLLSAYVIKNSKELVEHGQIQQHCVGTYGSRVKYGHCFILSIKAENALWTAQISPSNGVEQFLGYRNAQPPAHVVQELNRCVEGFRKLIRKTPENPDLFAQVQQAYANVLPNYGQVVQAAADPAVIHNNIHAIVHQPEENLFAEEAPF